MKKSGIMERGISACMMVRDEQENLGRCLESIKDFVDEIIIVDTGSIDRTVEIAESYGASVFHHPWQDNFSLHRNQSLGYAKYEWCFVIDADEEFFPDTKVKEWILNRPLEDIAIALTLHDMRDSIACMQFNTSRFFRNGVCQYQSIIHNEPVFEGKQALYCPGMYLKHYGYDLTPEKKQAKFERTVGLLNKRLELQPDDYLALFYLNQMYAGAELYKEAVEYGEEYVKHKEVLGDGRFNKGIYFTLVRCYMYLQNQEKAGEWLDEALVELPEDLDIALVLMEYGLNTKEYDLMVMGAKKYISLYDKYKTDPAAGGDRFIHSQSPETLAFCAYHLAVHQLRSGFGTLGVLSKALSKTDKEYTNAMLEELQQQLSPYGIKVSNVAGQAGKKQLRKGVH